MLLWLLVFAMLLLPFNVTGTPLAQHNYLIPRQSLPIADIPPECQSTCQPFLDVEQSCLGTANVTCLCSTEAIQSVVTCVSCVVQQPSATSEFKDAEQDDLNGLASGCKQAGFPVNISVQLNTTTSNASLSNRERIPLIIVVVMALSSVFPLVLP